MVSIVVPVYNAVEWLDTCIESLVEQTYREVEIILIDDCSTDGSLEKCDEWAKKDSRVKVIPFSENRGPSAARNEGLRNVHGEWVLFVDADDWLDRRCVEVVVEAAERQAADIVMWDLVEYTGRGDVSEKPLRGKVRLFEGKELEYLMKMALTFRTETEDSPLALIAPHCKLFRERIVKQAFFPEEVNLGEDTCFVIQTLVYAKRFLYLDQFFYHKRVLGNSLSLKRDKEYPERMGRYVNWMLRYCINEELVSDDILNDFIYAHLKEIVEHCFHVLPEKGQMCYYRKTKRFLDELDISLDICKVHERDRKKKRLLAEGKYWRYKVYFVFQNVCRDIWSKKRGAMSE